MRMLKIPSFYAGFMNGLFMLIILFIIIKKFNEIKTYDTYRQLILLIGLGILVGIHALIHLGMENIYKWNPLETGKFLN